MKILLLNLLLAGPTATGWAQVNGRGTDPYQSSKPAIRLYDTSSLAVGPVHWIDVAEKRCLDEADVFNMNGSAGALPQCEREAIQRWQGEMARLLALAPEQKAQQARWQAALTAEVENLKKSFTFPSGLTEAGAAQIRATRIAAMRVRVWEINNLMHGPGFSIPRHK